MIKPLREIAEPIADMSGPRRYLDAQKFFDADYPNGMFYYWKSAYLKHLDDEVMDTVIRHAGTRPSPLTSLDLWFLSGAMNRVPADKTAYARRDVLYALAIESNWTDPEQSDANIAWTREAFDDMQRFTHGAYLNFPGFVEDRDELLHGAYGDNLERLREIKAQYDPDNLFHGTLNIVPAEMNVEGGRLLTDLALEPGRRPALLCEVVGCGGSGARRSTARSPPTILSSFSGDASASISKRRRISRKPTGTSFEIASVPRTSISPSAKIRACRSSTPQAVATDRSVTPVQATSASSSISSAVASVPSSPVAGMAPVSIGPRGLSTVKARSPSRPDPPRGSSPERRPGPAGTSP